MIITIRNQIKQSAFRYVAFFIFVVLGAGMISIPSLIKEDGIAGSWAAKVNGEKISYKEFARETAQQSELLAQIRAQYGQYADLLFHAMGWPTDPQALALESLIKTTLLNQFTRNMGIHVHSDYIAESLNNSGFARKHLQNIVPAFVFDQSGALNAEKLHMYLQHRGMSAKEFEQMLEDNISHMQALQFVAMTSYVPSFDIKQEYIARTLGKDFSYLVLSYDSFLAAEKKNAVSNEDAQLFYDKENVQRRRYWVPEKRDALVWKMNPENYQVSISEDDINNYYQDNKIAKYVLDPIKIEVRQISEKQLSSDVTLDMVREDVINNPTSEWNKKWELLKPFARGEKKETIEREAFLLQNEGDISSVVDTKDGKVIIQLVKRIPRTYKPLSAVRNEIRSVLTEKRFKKSFVKDLKAIVASNDIQTVESLIAQKSAKKEAVVGVIKNDTQLSQELFGLQKNEYGVFVEGNVGFVVLLTNIVERNLPGYESIKDVVAQDLREERAQLAMANTMKEMQEAAHHESFVQLAQEYNCTMHRTGMIKPDDNKKMQELDKKDLPAKDMLLLDKEGALLTHVHEKGSTLIKLETIEPYESASGDEIRSMEALLTNNRMKMQIEGVVASLHRNATIETNESTQLAGEEYSE